MSYDQKCKNDFSGQVVIITGAARGIGRATSLGFIRQGANVVAVDLLEKELLQLGQSLIQTDMKVLPIKADVSNNLEVQDVIQKTLNHFGRIDILVNIAGIVGPAVPIKDLAEDDWDRVFKVNLKSIFLFCKNTVPIMINNKKGSIVNVASIAGKEGNANQGAYSSSKAAVICFSRVLAREVAKEGIRVNCVAPALIKTEMASSLPNDLKDALLAKIPMGRMGDPEEVADLILFLSSEKSSFITGQCFNITGGRGDY